MDTDKIDIERLHRYAPELLDAAIIALCHLNMQAMRYCDDAPEQYERIKPFRSKLSMAISLATGHVYGGSLQDSAAAKAALRNNEY
jgi:hypothetical protein